MFVMEILTAWMAVMRQNPRVVDPVTCNVIVNLIFNVMEIDAFQGNFKLLYQFLVHFVSFCLSERQNRFR